MSESVRARADKAKVVFDTSAIHRNEVTREKEPVGGYTGSEANFDGNQDKKVNFDEESRAPQRIAQKVSD